MFPYTSEGFRLRFLKDFVRVVYICLREAATESFRSFVLQKRVAQGDFFPFTFLLDASSFSLYHLAQCYSPLLTPFVVTKQF